MAVLTQAQIEDLIKAATSAELTEHRRLLLEGLPLDYIASLPRNPAPGLQLRADVIAGPSPRRA